MKRISIDDKLISPIVFIAILLFFAFVITHDYKSTAYDCSAADSKSKIEFMKDCSQRTSGLGCTKSAMKLFCKPITGADNEGPEENSDSPW